MATAPTSSIIFCNVPFNSDYKHIVDNITPEQMTAYGVKTVTSYDYVRKDDVIRAEVTIDDIINCNYVMYRNAAHENKYFFAFIESIDYINERVTNIKITTDVWQTWKNDITFSDCFVEREHVADDTIGLHTLEENLETGEYIRNTDIIEAGLDNLAIVVAVSEEPTTPDIVSGGMYNGIYSGVKYYGSTNPAAITTFLTSYNDKGKAEAVLSVFMCPNDFVGVAYNETVDTISLSALGTFENVTGNARPATIDGYTPVNNKLLSYPYNLLYVHNNSGGSAIYRYELFNGTPAFTMYGAVAPNPVFKIIPSNYINYTGSGNEQDMGLTIGGFPICAWITDPYKNWVAQNAGSTALGLVGGAGAMLAGAATGGAGLVAAGAIAGGAMGVLGQIAQIEQRKMQPLQANGQINSGSANTAVTWNDFFIYGKCIREEYARIIDEYFSVYGYKVSRFKTPQFTSRQKWNYIKTIDCHIKGGIPLTDKNRLEKIFNDGTTVWHLAANIGNYSLSNEVVS